MTASPLPPVEEVHAEDDRPELNFCPAVPRPPSSSPVALKKLPRKNVRPVRLALTVLVGTVLFYFTLCAIFESSPKRHEPSISASDFRRLEAKIDALTSSVIHLSQQVKNSHDHLQTLIHTDKQKAHDSSSHAGKNQWDFLTSVVSGFSSLVDPKQNEDRKEPRTKTTTSSSSSSSGAPPRDPNHPVFDFHTANTIEEVYMCVRGRRDIEKFNDENETPLISAIKRGNFDVVHSLLAQGANPNNSHPAAMRPIHWAAMGGEDKMIEELVKKGANVNDLSREGTPLTIAATMGHVEAVKTLLRLKANTEAKDKHEWTALMRASSEGHIDVVDLLLLSRANVNAQSPSQDSSLSLAANRGHLDVMNMLASHGADLDHRDSSGWTILMRAVINGNPMVAVRLIDLGCDVNLQRKDGRTALMIAAEENETEIVRFLLARGADTQLVGKRGKKAIDLTRSQEIKDILQEHESTKPKKQRK